MSKSLSTNKLSGINGTIKTLLLDIETSPIIASVWQLFDVNVGLDQVKLDWHLLSFAAKWLGDKTIIYEDQSEKKDLEDDSGLAKSLHKLLDEADVVVAHNGRKFDLKKINARLLVNGFPPPSPYKIVDTVEIARRHFGFSSNKLAFLSEHLCNRKKFAHKKFPGFTLWKECIDGNKEAWAEMRKYNIQDVLSLEELYLKLRAWDNKNPNKGVYLTGTVCPKCGSAKIEKRGFSFTQVGKYQRYQCLSCFGWSRGAQAVNTREERMALLR